MKRMVVLAAVAVAAIGSANCANSRDGASSASIMAPSAIETSGVVDTMAKGGGGGGGKPGGGGTTGGGGGTIALRIVNDFNTDGLPSFRDVVTFDVQTGATAQPWVTLKCYQNGTLVSLDSNGMFPTSLDQNFTLGPTPAWPSGVASCTATLSAYGGSALASMSFQTN